MRTTWGGVACLVAAVVGGCGFEEQFDGDGEVLVASKKLPACKAEDHDGHGHGHGHKDHKDKDKDKDKDRGCYTTTNVGPAGGVVEHPAGVTLSIPAGALDHDVAIRVLDEGALGPAGTQLYSPVFTFEPDGTLFARPVEVQFEVPATVTAATVYWSRSTASGLVWDRIPATVAGGIATSQITHFSGGGAGEPSDAFDLHVIQTVTWHRLDSQHIERTDFATGAAVAHAPGGDLLSEAWVDSNGNPVLGEGMIRNIPAGEMWIQVGNQWVFTSLAATPVLDLSSEKFGTYGRPTPDINSPHPITINVTGASPTSPDDALELLVPDANAFYFAFPDDGPVVATGVTDFTLDWDLNSAASIDGLITTADTAYFAQVVPSTTPAPANLPYMQMVKIGIADPTDVPQTGGTMNVALSDLPPNQTPLSSSLAVDEYQSMFSTPSPGATSLLSPADDASSGWPTDVRVRNVFDLDVQSGSFGLQGIAGGRNVGALGATADFAYMSLSGAVMGGAFDTGPLSYGVPAGDWDIFAALDGFQAIVVQLRCPVDATPCSTPAGWARQQVGAAVFVGFGDRRLVDQASAFTPAIGPARDLRIGGLDAQSLQAGVGTEPTISWSATTVVPPSNRLLAAPQTFSVAIFHYTLTNGSGEWRTRRELAARFITATPSITVPAGILAPGEVYSFVVRAARRDATAGVSPLQEPNRNRYPSEDWTTASAPFTP